MRVNAPTNGNQYLTLMAIKPRQFATDKDTEN